MGVDGFIFTGKNILQNLVSHMFLVQKEKGFLLIQNYLFSLYY